MHIIKIIVHEALIHFIVAPLSTFPPSTFHFCLHSFLMPKNECATKRTRGLKPMAHSPDLHERPRRSLVGDYESPSTIPSTSDKIMLPAKNCKFHTILCIGID